MKIELETSETIALTETTNKIMDLTVALLRPRTLAPMKAKPEDKGPNFLDYLKFLAPFAAEILDRVLPPKERAMVLKKIQLSELPKEVKDTIIEELSDKETNDSEDDKDTNQDLED